MQVPNKAFDLEFANENQQQGWVFGQPSGMATMAWPRSRVNGLPMAHIWTFLVPEQYRVKGSNFVAIALFQADDHVADRVEGVAHVIATGQLQSAQNAQPFWEGLAQYANNKHPMEIYMEDIIDGGWALIWLTEAEFFAAPTAIPNKSLAVPPHYSIKEGANPYNATKPPKYIQIVERLNDPNIGKRLEDFPDEEDENAYIAMFSDKGEALGLEDLFFGKTHFGGTANPVQATPEFSPFYIEFEEGFGNANMGGGNGQIDLQNHQLDWACG